MTKNLGRGKRYSSRQRLEPGLPVPDACLGLEARPSQSLQKAMQALHATVLTNRSTPEGPALQSSWSTSDILGFIGLGGIYHLHGRFMSHLHAKGIDFVLQRLVFGETEAIRESRSPAVMVRRSQGLADRLPPVLLVHGTSDKIVPQEQSEEFQKTLSALGADVQLVFSPGEGHNDPVIHSPLMSNHDTVQAILLAMRRWGAQYPFSASTDKVETADDEDALSTSVDELFGALPKWPRTPKSAGISDFGFSKCRCVPA